MARYLRLIHGLVERELVKPRSSPATSFLRSTQRHFRSGSLMCASTKGDVQYDASSSKSRVIVSRVMGPDDTQMYKMVHGGVVMQLLEEAGTVITMQYCNAQRSNDDAGGAGGGGGAGETGPKVVTVSACVENTEFLRPMFIGELAEVHAEIGYTSKHSMQANIEIYAKNLMKGEERLTIRAKIWYVAMTTGKESKLVEVPKNVFSDPKMEEAGKQAYLALKGIRDGVIRPRLDARPLMPEEIKEVPQDPERGSVNYSQVVTRHAIHPSHCWAGETYLRGGLAMKWMDEAGSLSATLHSAYPGFTISVDTIVFLRKLRLGSMLVSTSRPVFVSNRSMEVLITGDELFLRPGKGMLLQRAVEAIFTFVAPDEKGKPRELPPLKLKTEEEKRLFEERKQLYDKRQQARKQ